MILKYFEYKQKILENCIFLVYPQFRMILKRINSWIENDLRFNLKKSTKIAFIMEILNLNKKRFIISDGLHFIEMKLSNAAYLKLIKDYSPESFSLKSGLIFILEYNFETANNILCMNIKDCFYLGEGQCAESINISKTINLQTYEDICRHQTAKDTFHLDFNVEPNITNHINIKRRKATNSRRQSNYIFADKTGKKKHEVDMIVETRVREKLSTNNFFNGKITLFNSIIDCRDDREFGSPQMKSNKKHQILNELVNYYGEPEMFRKIINEEDDNKSNASIILETIPVGNIQDYVEKTSNNIVLGIKDSPNLFDMLDSTPDLITESFINNVGNAAIENIDSFIRKEINQLYSLGSSCYISSFKSIDPIINGHSQKDKTPIALLEDKKVNNLLGNKPNLQNLIKSKEEDVNKFEYDDIIDLKHSQDFVNKKEIEDSFTNKNVFGVVKELKNLQNKIKINKNSIMNNKLKQNQEKFVKRIKPIKKLLSSLEDDVEILFSNFNYIRRPYKRNQCRINIQNEKYYDLFRIKDRKINCENGNNNKPQGNDLNIQPHKSNNKTQYFKCVNIKGKIKTVLSMSTTSCNLSEVEEERHVMDVGNIIADSVKLTENKEERQIMDIENIITDSECSEIVINRRGHINLEVLYKTNIFTGISFMRTKRKGFSEILDGKIADRFRLKMHFNEEKKTLINKIINKPGRKIQHSSNIYKFFKRMKDKQFSKSESSWNSSISFGDYESPNRNTMLKSIKEDLICFLPFGYESESFY